MDSLSIEISALSLGSVEQFIGKRIVYNTENNLTVFIKSQCNCAHMKIQNKICSTVNRIQNPVSFFSGKSQVFFFFRDQGNLRKCFSKFLFQKVLHGQIHICHIVSSSLYHYFFVIHLF